MWWFIHAQSCSRQGGAGHHCPLHPSESSWPPAICVGHQCPGREDFFHLRQCSFTGPCPHVSIFSHLPFLPQAQGHTSNLGHVHPEGHSPDLVLCSHSHQGSPGPLRPLHPCRRKGWIRKIGNCTGTAAKPPPDKSHITVWQCKATSAGLGFVPNRKIKKNKTFWILEVSSTKRR